MPRSKIEAASKCAPLVGKEKEKEAGRTDARREKGKREKGKGKIVGRVLRTA